MMRRVLRQTLVVGAFIVAAATSPVRARQVPTQAAREQQWIYRDVLGSGTLQPTAVFLSWDYSGVVFTATCDMPMAELVLRTQLDTGPNAPAVEPMEISSSASTVRLRTIQVEGSLEGRIKVTKELSNILRSKGELQVFIPTEMGEPLYVGRAAPLRRVGLMCGR